MPEVYDKQKYKTPTGTRLQCKGWTQEAALRMLLNNLDPEVAERPEDLIVYDHGALCAQESVPRGSALDRGGLPVSLKTAFEQIPNIGGLYSALSE